VLHFRRSLNHYDSSEGTFTRVTFTCLIIITTQQEEPFDKLSHLN
jgi:hypothetical protein